MITNLVELADPRRYLRASIVGDTVYKRLTGIGLGFNNHYAPVTLGPDGTAYVGTLGGLVRVTDNP